MNKQKRDSKNILQWVIPSILLVLFLIVTLFNYSADMKEEIVSRTEDDLKNQVLKISEYYSDEYKVIKEITNISADHLAEMKDLISFKSQSLLAGIIKYTSAKDAIIIQENGVSMNSKGECSKITDILDSDKIMNGKFQISSPFSYPEIRGNCIAVSAPIKSGDQILGVLVVVTPFDKLNYISKSLGYSARTYMVIDQDGAIIEYSDKAIEEITESDNLFDTLEKATFVRGNYKKIEQNIGVGKGGIVSISFSEKVSLINTYYIIYEPISEYGWSSVMIVPATQINRTIKLQQGDTNSLVTKILIALLVFITILVTINIINKAKFIRESKELKDKAETDLLTDLLNKIATQRKISEYLESEGKNKKSIMFVLDIDNFKKINDTMGHAFGDEVLSTLGRRVKSEFRINDIVGRTGGDEFVVFLKDLKDDATIKKEADRVANFFKNFVVGEYVKYSATASIGAAIYPDDAKDFESLYKSADQALYKAKKCGKNQMAFYKEDAINHSD